MINDKSNEADILNYSDSDKSKTKIPFFKSLSFWMPVTLVVLGVIPPVAIGIGWIENRVEMLLGQAAERILELEAEKLEGNVSQWMEMNVLALKNLSEQPAIVSLDPKQQKPTLEKIDKNYEHLYLIHTMDLNGINIARSDDNKAKDYSNRLYFKRMIAGDEIAYQPLIGKTSKKPAVCMSSPIRQQETIAAVAVACSSLNTIAEQIKEIDLGETSIGIIVDNQGKVIAHSDSQFTSGDTLADLSGYPPVANVLAGNQNSIIFVDDAGIEWLASGKLMDNGWAAITLQHTDEAFLLQRQSKKIANASIFLVILLSGIITSIVASRAIRPIAKLTDISRKVAQGDFNSATKSDRNDEIGVLSNSFYKMAQRLKESFVTLETNVEERTLELSQEKEQLEAAIFKLLDEVSDATEGDLTVRAKLESVELSTIADLFNAIISNLQDIAIEAKESSSSVGLSLKQNEQAIRLLAEQAIAEAQETRDTLISVEQMSQSIKAVSQNASQAEKITDDTYNTIINSANNMDLTVKSILELRSTVGETSKKMKRLGESSQKISQVVSFIEEIALKTNILAINASVEAGRAGEYGQGFTIVAEQVGALAEQSAAATKEIANIVATIQAETQEVNQAMESGTTQVVETSRLVENTKQSLGLVLVKSQEINQLMSSISQSTVSQADTSQNVTKLMQKIASLSETSSQSSAEVAQSIVETAQIAAKLEFTVGQFKVAE